MAIANEQLNQIFLELKNKFQNDRYIKVVPLGDNYSEKYEIRYNILGVVLDANGSVNEAKEHSILISIPFGYPHFPPSCRPQSATFHPDFDQAAICIGDFWNKDKTLSELIIHIGQMISGEKYSTENAFNDTAVAWYTQNSARLPFETLSFSSEPEDLNTGQEIDDEVKRTRNIDTLDESDFSASHDYINLEKEEGVDEIAFPPTAQPRISETLETVLLLIRQKKYFELSSILASLPENEQFEDRDEIERNVEDILNKARKFQKEADELEHQGNPAEALQLLEKISDLVPDFPNINENLSRTQKTYQLSNEWTSDSATETYSDQDGKKSSDISKVKQRLAFFDEQRKATLKYIPIIAVVLVIGLLIAGIIPFLLVTSKLKNAELSYTQCTTLLEQEKFTQAMQNCETAQLLLKDVYFFKKKQQSALTAKIKQTIASEKMQQGLAGKIFFHGKFVQKRDKEIVLDFEKLKEAGDVSFKEKSWADASEKYLAALDIVNPIKDSFDETILRDVTENYTIAQINVLLNKGRWFLAAGELEKTELTFNQALLLVKQLPTELQEPYLFEINSKTSELEYLQLLDLGKQFFVSNDWQGAIKQYEKALKLRNESSLAARQEEVESLYANMAEAELYSLISSGKEAFAKSQWNKAIVKYEEAIELLNSKKSILERLNPTYIKQQLKRIILRVRIVQSKQDADAKLEKHLYKEAIAVFKKVNKLITESGFKDDEEFNSIFSGTKSSIVEAQKKLAKAEKIAYLVANYKDIFEDNYAAAVPQYLKDPKATFVKNIDRKELYELQCLEEGQGRKIRLVMLYLYDPETKKWAFYSEDN